MAQPESVLRSPVPVIVVLADSCECQLRSCCAWGQAFGCLVSCHDARKWTAESISLRLEAEPDRGGGGLRKPAIEAMMLPIDREVS
jgi:hypothetical protein